MHVPFIGLNSANGTKQLGRGGHSVPLLCGHTPQLVLNISKRTVLHVFFKDWFPYRRKQRGHPSIDGDMTAMRGRP